MKRFILITLFAHGAVFAEPDATLVRANGQTIPGAPLRLEKDPAQPLPALVWDNDGKPATFAQADLLELRLTAPPAEALPASYALLNMNNGDCLRGKLVAMDETTVTLRTAFAGELKLRREMVGNLRVIQRAPNLFTATPADWRLEPEGNWTALPNSIVSKAPGNATLTMQYPQQFRLAFDLEWKTSPRLQIFFLANEKGDTGYYLSINDRFISLSKRMPREAMLQGAFNGATASFNDIDDRSKVRFELVVDSRAGFLGLLINGRLVQQTGDPSPVSNEIAKVFQISTQSQLRLSGVTLSPWDGNVAALLSDTSASNPPGDQQLVLRNGDVVTAATMKIDAGKAEVSSAHGPIKIPVDRLRAVGMPKPPGNPPTPKKLLGDVRAWFPDGGRVTFRLDDLKDGKITGFSQQFGTAEFDLKAFNRIEMNIDNFDLEPHRGKLSW